VFLYSKITSPTSWPIEGDLNAKSDPSMHCVLERIDVLYVTDDGQHEGSFDWSYSDQAKKADIPKAAATGSKLASQHVIRFRKYRIYDFAVPEVDLLCL
jgi:hypothetical protein